jgi:hypothetical protein
MRFYLKLLVLIAIFVAAARRPFWRTLGDLAYDLRVAHVHAFGSAEDVARLIDDTQYMEARELGGLDLYLKGKRYHQLVAQRLADAAARGQQLGEEELANIRYECQWQAYGPPTVRSIEPIEPIEPAVTWP